jgi:hypothetical protein
MSKQVVCVFDSTDNTGKTPISTEVSRVTGIPRFKNVDEHCHFLNNPDYFKFALKHVDTYFFKYLKESGASVILDRAWPSEWVYSKVMGRETDEQTLDWIDRFAASIGTKIVMPYRTSYDNVEDYDVIKEKIWEIDRTYTEFAKWTRCEVLRFNVDARDTRSYVNQVVDFLRP